jgi:hypothetical protein
VVAIDSKGKNQITARFDVSSEHPPQLIEEFKLTTEDGKCRLKLKQAVQVIQPLKVPEFNEIGGFKQAVEMVLAGQHGKPQDFLYWLAQQRPHQFALNVAIYLTSWLTKVLCLNIRNRGHSTAYG